MIDALFGKRFGGLCPYARRRNLSEFWTIPHFDRTHCLRLATKSDTANCPPNAGSDDCHEDEWSIDRLNY